MADENTAAVQIHSDSPIPNLDLLDWFWVEINSSQARTGPAVTVGFVRNLVITTDTPSLTKPNTGDPHAYFNALAAGGGVILSRGWRSQAEIDSDSQQSPNTEVTYNATEDAAEVEVDTDKASIANQVRPSFDAISSGVLWFVWEWKGGTTWQANRGDVFNHKAFQFGRDSSPGDDRAIEPRFRYSLGDWANHDIRSYVGGEQGDGGRLEPQDNEFTLTADVWTRFFYKVQF